MQQTSANLSEYAIDVLRNTQGKGNILFFSGGSALADVSRLLARLAIPSVHLITPFDSGGSSALLRQAFNMPAVGDLRNRLLCLARTDLVGQALPALCAMRFDKDSAQYVLKAQLQELAKGEHAAMRKLSASLRDKLTANFSRVMRFLPSDFDLQGASIGNLLLTGAYLRLERNLNKAVKEFGELLQIEGTVRPIATESLHLAVRLSDGEVVVGQHLITGKEVPGLDFPINELFLTDAEPQTILPGQEPDIIPERVDAFIGDTASRLIKSANCICYPMGSFYSSLLANLLPAGVGRAVSKANCPKVYVPGVGIDPEVQQLSVAKRAELIVDTLRIDAGEKVKTGNLITHVVLDPDIEYPGGIDEDKLNSLGVTVVAMPLLDKKYSSIHFDPYLVLKALAELLAVEG